MKKISCKCSFTKAVMLNSFQHLHLNHPLFKAEEILNQVQDDNRHGFTLIELLVVVLIISILAAVAVPQYQKAVTKAQFAQLEILADALYKSQKAYYLENSRWASTLDVLDVLPPGTLSEDKRKIVQGNIRCEFNYTYNTEIQCVYLVGNSQDTQKPFLLRYVNSGVKQCRAYSEKASRLCAFIANQPFKELENGWVRYDL